MLSVCLGFLQKEGAVARNCEESAPASAFLAKYCGPAGSIERRVNLLDLEEIAAGSFKIVSGERSQVAHDTMRGQDQQARTVHVDEGHHGEFVRGILTTIRGCGGTAFVAVVECGLVAVVTVGNDQLFVTHLSPHRIDQSYVGDLPDA